MKHSLFSSTSGTTAHPTHEQIARRAEELWQNYGAPADRDEEIWLEAEHQLNRATASAAESTVAKNGKITGGAVKASTQRPTTAGRGRMTGKGK
jgi:hypothetical protein